MKKPYVTIGLIICSVMLAVYAGARPAFAETVTYANDEYHYSFTLPDGWMQMPDELFQKVTDYYKRQNQPPPSVAYYRGIDDAGMMYPFMLVQNQQVKMPAYDEIEHVITGSTIDEAATKASKSLATMVNNPNIQNKKLDRTRNMFSFSSTVDVTDVGKTHAVSYNFFGRESLVGVYLYDIAEHSPVIEQAATELVDSFSFAPGFTYDEKQAASSNSSVIQTALTGGSIGAVVGGLVGLAAWSIRRAKNKLKDSSHKKQKL